MSTQQERNHSMRTKTTRLSLLVACLGLALVLSLGVAANPDNGKGGLTIGSKKFPESEITGEIYAQALAAAGYKVKTDLSLGSETIAFKALKRGSVSGYP